MPFDDEKKIKRLKEREANLVSRGNKAVDEGRERKADRLLRKADRTGSRIVNLQARAFTQEEKDAMPMKNAAIDRIGNLGNSTITNFTNAVKGGTPKELQQKAAAEAAKKAMQEAKKLLKQGPKKN